MDGHGRGPRGHTAPEAGSQLEAPADEAGWPRPPPLRSTQQGGAAGPGPGRILALGKQGLSRG